MAMAIASHGLLPPPLSLFSSLFSLARSTPGAEDLPVTCRTAYLCFCFCREPERHTARRGKREPDRRASAPAPARCIFPADVAYVRTESLRHANPAAAAECWTREEAGKSRSKGVSWEKWKITGSQGQADESRDENTRSAHYTCTHTCVLYLQSACCVCMV